MGLVGDQTVYILDKVSVTAFVIFEAAVSLRDEDMHLVSSRLTTDSLSLFFSLQVEGNFQSSFDNGNTPVWGSFLNLADNT